MPVLAPILLSLPQGYGIRIVLKRFDWKAASAQQSKSWKKWDAIKQLARYREVIGRDAPGCAESMQNGELFQDRTDDSQ